MPLSSSVAAESTGAWHFFVEHYENRTQAYRDSKYTYIQSNGSLYVGLDPPEDAVPYVKTCLLVFSNIHQLIANLLPPFPTLLGSELFTLVELPWEEAHRSMP